MRISPNFYVICVLSIFLLTGCNNDSGDSVIKTCVSDFILHPLDNSGSEPVVSGNNSFPKDAYILSIEMKLDSRPSDDFYSYTKTELTNPITSIRIISLTEFNEYYPAGSDITVLFRQYPVAIRYPLHDYTMEGEPIVFMDYYNGYFYKALLAPPTAGTHVFQVRMIFQSGLILTKETEPAEFY